MTLEELETLKKTMAQKKRKASASSIASMKVRFNEPTVRKVLSKSSPSAIETTMETTTMALSLLAPSSLTSQPPSPVLPSRPSLGAHLIPSSPWEETWGVRSLETRRPFGSLSKEVYSKCNWRGPCNKILGSEEVVCDDFVIGTSHLDLYFNFSFLCIS